MDEAWTKADGGEVALPARQGNEPLSPGACGMDNISLHCPVYELP